MRIIKARIGNKNRACGLAGGQERVEGKWPKVNNGAGAQSGYWAGGPKWILGRRPEVTTGQAAQSEYGVGGPE